MKDSVAFSRSVSRLVGQPVIRSFIHSVSQSAGRLVSPSVGQSVSQSVESIACSELALALAVYFQNA
jgi:hypothetical protein